MINYVDYVQKLMEGPAQTVGYLGTRDDHMRVSVTFIISFVVKDNPFRVVAYLPESALGDARRNLGISNYVTLLIVNAGTFKGVQIKGNAVLRQGDAEGESFLVKNTKRLMQFYNMELYKPVRMTPLMAVEITVKEIYDQTPGVGAGKPLQLKEVDGE